MNVFNYSISLNFSLFQGLIAFKRQCLLCGLVLNKDLWVTHLDLCHVPLINACNCDLPFPEPVKEHMYIRHTRLILICKCNILFKTVQELLFHIWYNNCFDNICVDCNRTPCSCDDDYIKRLFSARNDYTILPLWYTK